MPNEPINLLFNWDATDCSNCSTCSPSAAATAAWSSVLSSCCLLELILHGSRFLPQPPACPGLGCEAPAGQVGCAKRGAFASGLPCLICHSHGERASARGAGGSCWPGAAPCPPGGAAPCRAGGCSPAVFFCFLNREADEGCKKPLERLLNIWQERSVYGSEFIQQLKLSMEDSNSPQTKGKQAAGGLCWSWPGGVHLSQSTVRS